MELISWGSPMQGCC